MAGLIVAFDAGSSLTKIIYGWIKADSEYETKYMVMGPEYKVLPPESGQFLDTGDFGLSQMGLPEDNAWIRYSENGEIALLGRMARENRAKSRLKPLKSTMIVPKVLATIGAIAEKENLGAEIELTLTILLPYNEIRSKEELEASLTAKISNFYFREHQISVKLNKLKIAPEATGLALLYRSLQQYKFKKINHSFLMLGHRNTSLLVFEQGSFSKAKSSTTDLGFYDLIDRFTEKVPGVSREDFLATIKTSPAEKSVTIIDESHSHLLAQIRLDLKKLSSTGKSNEFLLSAYKASLMEYWITVEDWLKEVYPSSTDLLWPMGGAAQFIRNFVSQKYKTIELMDLRYITHQFFIALNFWDINSKQNFFQQNLINRALDVWGMYAISSGYFLKERRSA